MKQRTITILISLLIFLPVLYFGGPIFDAFVVLLGILSMFELIRMTNNKILSIEGIASILAMVTFLVPDTYTANILPPDLNNILLFYFLVIIILIATIYRHQDFNFEKAGSLVLGAVYIGVGYHFLIETRYLGLTYVVFALLIVWTTDTFAYLGGRLFGHTKLAPAISPNKTVEGAISGIIMATIVSIFYIRFLFPEAFSMVDSVIIAIGLSIVGQMGDLVESALKRHYGVKDSGTALPGHGGFLDRFDSILFVLPTFHFIVSFL